VLTVNAAFAEDAGLLAATLSLVALSFAALSFALLLGVGNSHTASTSSTIMAKLAMAGRGR
jgi:hypothetical protein